jgi:hypothetical protein
VGQGEPRGACCAVDRLLRNRDRGVEVPLLRQHARQRCRRNCSRERALDALGDLHALARHASRAREVAALEPDFSLGAQQPAQHFGRTSRIGGDRSPLDITDGGFSTAY